MLIFTYRDKHIVEVLQILKFKHKLKYKSKFKYTIKCKTQKFNVHRYKSEYFLLKNKF